MNARVLGSRDADAALRATLDVAPLAVDGAPEAAAQAVAAAVVRHGGTAAYTSERFVVAARFDALEALEAEVPPVARPLVRELLRALAADRATAPHVRLRSGPLDLALGAKVMGILNVTPDSFYDGGRYGTLDAARARAEEIAQEGAAIIDIGGQSYAAGARPLDEGEERARVVPVVEALVRDRLGVALSIDTWKSGVAEAALAAGADLINDCSGLRDERLADVVARAGAALVVMHVKGELGIRAAHYHYDDALAEIGAFLRVRLERARAAGVAADALVVDPGLEFGKEPETDLEILSRFGELRSLGAPILFAASRKSFIGAVLGRPARELLAPSLATAAVGITAGARLVRAHDVAETVALARMLAAIENRSIGNRVVARPV